MVNRCLHSSVVECTKWTLCMLCQFNDANKVVLVLHPRIESYKHVLQQIQDRASLHDGNYIAIHGRLRNATEETLNTVNTCWHRTCYSNATNKHQIQRDRDCIEYALSTGKKTKTKERKYGNGGHRTVNIWLSNTIYEIFHKTTDKKQCFFCRKDDGNFSSMLGLQMPVNN